MANGPRAGDFTCTDDNVTRLLQSVIGVTKDVKGTVVWAADEVVYAPEIAVPRVHVDEIAGFTEASG